MTPEEESSLVAYHMNAVRAACEVLTIGLVGALMAIEKVNDVQMNWKVLRDVVDEAIDKTTLQGTAPHPLLTSMRDMLERDPVKLYVVPKGEPPAPD